MTSHHGTWPLGSRNVETVVVNHLHGKTGRLTTWANGKENSRVVHFVTESALLFVQISFIYRKTTTKA